MHYLPTQSEEGLAVNPARDALFPLLNPLIPWVLSEPSVKSTNTMGNFRLCW